VPRFGVTPFVWEGVACVAAGTGYTGEDGVECAVPVDAADALWTALLGAGALPAGLGARDTLRLEAALPLHGHELGPGITPLQAGLGWVVGWDKEEFRGRAALLAERERGVDRRLVGLATVGRQPPREGSALVNDGRPAGTITSGNYSPMLGHGIALGFIDSSLDPQPSMAVDVVQRGRSVPATVVTTPFTRAGEWASSA
jgi:aminomethyltransferase